MAAEIIGLQVPETQAFSSRSLAVVEGGQKGATKNVAEVPAAVRQPETRAAQHPTRPEVIDPFAARTPEFTKHLAGVLTAVDAHRFGSGKKPDQAAADVLKGNANGNFTELKRFIGDTADTDIVVTPTTDLNNKNPQTREPDPDRYLTGLLRDVTKEVKNHVNPEDQIDTRLAVDRVLRTSGSPSSEKLRKIMQLGAEHMQQREEQILAGQNPAEALTPADVLREAVRNAELQEILANRQVSYRRTTTIPEVKRNPHLAAKVVRGEIDIQSLTQDVQQGLRESYAAGLITAEEWEKRSVGALVEEAERQVDITARKKKARGAKPAGEATITVLRKATEAQVHQRVGDHAFQEVPEDADITAEMLLWTAPEDPEAAKRELELVTRRLDRDGGVFVANVPTSVANELQSTQSQLGKLVDVVDFGKRSGIIIQAELPQTEQVIQTQQTAPSSAA